MTAALRVLLYLTVCGTALACLVAIVQALVGRRLPSRFYYFAYLLVLARFALPIPGFVPTERTAAPVQTQPQSVDSGRYVMALPSDDPVAGLAVDTAIEPVMEAAVDAAAADIAEETAALMPEMPETSRLAEPAAEPTAEKRALSMSSWDWTAVWALGAGIGALWYIHGYRAFTRRLRQMLRRPTQADERVYAAVEAGRRPMLARSEAVATPMLFGVFRPVIVLPDREYDDETLRMILLHELTHYRCGDVLLKWLAAAVHVLHWFNPFMLLIQRRLDECCELSCDERLLRGMDKGQRQDYGHALLAMAGDASLSAVVGFTTFATEKRTLKERLEQIMKYKTRKGLVFLWALAAALLLSACAVAIGPGGEKELTITVDTAALETESGTLPPQSSGEQADLDDDASGEASGEARAEQVTVKVSKPKGGETVTVSTVDEFLAAIAPGNEIHLVPGVYTLNEAADYGTERIGGCYTWQEVSDGYQLVIHDLEELTIVSEGNAEIQTLPRYADVLKFLGCSDIRLEGVTLGHTEGAGGCVGSVVHFSGVLDAQVERCALYGCGTIGIEAEDSQHITALDTAIYECSLSAAQATNCVDVRLLGCDMYDCGGEHGDVPVVYLTNCCGVGLVNCEVHDNRAKQLVSAFYAESVWLKGCAIYGNEIGESVFDLTKATVTVDGCFFNVGNGAEWITAVDGMVCNAAGVELAAEDLMAMQRVKAADYDLNFSVETPALDIETRADGRNYVTVSTVDEFLAAIAPNTTVHLAAGEYNLADARYYGVPVSEYYGWTKAVDGPELIIGDVDGLIIEGEGADKTTLLAEPRYAEIIHFYFCNDLTVTGLTAGHVEQPVGCGAGVLRFTDCERTEVAYCGLFGCGIRGVTATQCVDMRVADTEIYDCSSNAAQINASRNVTFENCDIHDCVSNEIVVNDSTNVTQDGKVL